MDIMMPVMNGLEATRKLRALNRSYAATVPIIAMTANVFQDDIENSLAAGMNAHLTKPLDVDKRVPRRAGSAHQSSPGKPRP